MNATTEILDALVRRHDPAEWQMFHEVTFGERRTDALALNMWASRGHALWGYEIKVSRSDWLRERKHPEKADGIIRYCAQWWLATPNDKSIIPDDEVPDGWGLIRWTGKQWRTVVRAEKRTPKPIPDVLWISMLKNHRRVDEHALEQERRAGYSAGHQDAAKTAQRRRSFPSTDKAVLDLIDALGLPRFRLQDPDYLAEIKSLVAAHDSVRKLAHAQRRLHRTLTAESDHLRSVLDQLGDPT